MARLTITSKATATLDLWLEELMKGALHLGELPLCIEALIHYGYALGRESRQLEVEQLERAVNRLHNLAFESDKERRDRLERLLSQALESASTEQWEQLEQDLTEMAGHQQNSNLVGITSTFGGSNGSTTETRGARAA